MQGAKNKVLPGQDAEDMSQGSYIQDIAGYINIRMILILLNTSLLTYLQSGIYI